ncbi:MAG: PAS domain S-box protein [Firmicutes bacterium]|nr:PAS domain S-box protein [Bacillota bacterium]
MPSLRFIDQYLHYFTRTTTSAELESRPDFIAKLMETVETLILVLDRQGRIIEFNPACERLSGYQRSEVIGRKFTFLIPPEEQPAVEKVMQELISKPQSLHYENHWLTKTGQKRLLAWSNSSFNVDSSAAAVICTGIDMTDVRERENRLLVLLEILELLASHESKDTVLAHILSTVQNYLGCDAAGIRLRRGDNYPYVQTVGFSEEFVKKESLLCCFQGSSIERDEDGVAVLDCICGRVIRGDLDEEMATSSGAFVTGNIHDLVAKAAKMNLPFNIRNHCGKAGYQSIALIPLRFNDSTIGLLQLNAHAENFFDEDDVIFLTLIGQSIGAALARFQAEQERHKTELILNTVIQKVRDGLLLGTPDGKVIIYNEVMERITGYSQAEVNQYGWVYLVFPEEKERRKVIQKARKAMSGKLTLIEATITCKDGTLKPVTFMLTPLEIEGKTYNFMAMMEK